MKKSTETQKSIEGLKIRKIEGKDLERIIAMEALNDEEKQKGWRKRMLSFLDDSSEREEILGYVAEIDDQVVGYILAETRAWEFGSSLCGWIFAVNVDPQYRRSGIALDLFKIVCQGFKDLDVDTIRTMVRRDEIRLLSFFRSSGFRSGPFTELELKL